MHPDPTFRSQQDWLDFADARGFAHIFAATTDGPMVVHAPVTRHGDRLTFHLARSNRIAGHLADAHVLVSISAVDGYISPNWYAQRKNQVPTWNFVAVEIEGIARRLEEADLIGQLDALAARHEPRANPTVPWTRDTMDHATFAGMLKAIAGFGIDVVSMRETVKLGQNKTPADRNGAVAGLLAAGATELAGAMTVFGAEA